MLVDKIRKALNNWVKHQTQNKNSCPPETITIFLTGYTPIEDKMLKKRMMKHTSSVHFICSKAECL